jgi:hypothetical protein
MKCFTKGQVERTIEIIQVLLKGGKDRRFKTLDDLKFSLVEDNPYLTLDEFYDLIQKAKSRI